MAVRRLLLQSDEGDLLIGDGVISALPKAVTAPRLDCEDLVLRPGNVNAHTHLYSGLAPLGLPAPERPPANFVEILERIWWRLDRALDAESLRAAADLYIAEALLHGTTTLIDHHESPCLIEGVLDILADSAQALGCRLVTCYGATERNGGLEEARRGLEECARFARDNNRPLVRAMVGLHASFTVSDDALRLAAESCRALALPMHVHVAEDTADVEDARRRGYKGPLERLLTHAAVPPGSILAHGVHLDESEVALAAEKGLWFVQNPRSNKANGVGFPFALTSTDRVALGTDGFPADMREEAEAMTREAAAAGQPLSSAIVESRRQRGWTIASERFGIPLGTLSPGAAGDVAAWSSAEGLPSAPTHVVVAGEVVVRDGKLVHGDLAVIRERASRAAPKLWERMAAIAGGDSA